MKSSLLFALPFVVLSFSCQGKSDVSPDAARSPWVDAAIPSPDADTGTHPRIETTACRYDIPEALGLSEGTDYECGDLFTFEDRNTAAQSIRVHFVRFFSPATSNNATIYFEGGPGGNGSSMVARLGRLGTAFLDALMVDGDFLVIAQRGTTLSVPSLDCDFSSECQQVAEDLTAFNTAYNADDVDEIRKLSSYDKLNVFGISYGSRLALEVMRRHGEHLRSAIIGGIVPSHVVWAAGTPSSFYSALTALNSSCADNAACASAYGDLEADFIAGVSQLNENPVYFDDGNIGLDGYTYASVLFRSMYSNASYPWLPLFISDMAQGRTDRVESYLVSFFDALGNGNIAQGMYYSVVCGEMFSPADQSLFGEINASVPAPIRDVFSGNWYSLLDICSSWPNGSLQAELAQPVVSELPTFVASGTIDPITPPSYGVAAAETLGDALVVNYQNSGHGSTVQSTCGRETFLAFLADPESDIDVSCAASMTTEYVMPSQALGQTLDSEALRLDLEMAPPAPLLHKQLRAARRN